MDICNKTSNEEMNAGGSDDNDEGVKAYVDDDNSDFCHNSIDPYQLKDKRKIIETVTDTDGILKNNDKQEDEKLETSDELGNKE